MPPRLISAACLIGPNIVLNVLAPLGLVEGAGEELCGSSEAKVSAYRVIIAF